MSLFPFFQWVQATGFATSIRESALVYPFIMMSHLAAIALFGGMILMGNLRLLGLALKDVPVTDVFEGLWVWKRVGFILVVGCGLLLLSAKAESYYPNPYYWLKMTLLVLIGVHGLMFRSSVYGNLKAIDRAPQIPAVAKLAATLSLVLWIGVLSAGRWIAYYEPPKRPAQAASR